MGCEFSGNVKKYKKTNKFAESYHDGIAELRGIAIVHKKLTLFFCYILLKN